MLQNEFGDITATSNAMQMQQIYHFVYSFSLQQQISFTGKITPDIGEDHIMCKSASRTVTQQNSAQVQCLAYRQIDAEASLSAQLWSCTSSEIMCKFWAGFICQFS